MKSKTQEAQELLDGLCKRTVKRSYKQTAVRYEMDDKQYTALRQFVDAVEHAVRTQDVSAL